MFVLCLIMEYFVSFLVSQLSCWVREDWLLYLILFGDSVGRILVSGE